jgi:6-phosphogluconolactonase
VAELRALADEEVPWNAVHLFQVDERIAPAGDPDRNLTHIGESLLRAGILPAHLHAMPVEAQDMAAAAARYAREPRAWPARLVLDLVHLGLARRPPRRCCLATGARCGETRETDRCPSGHQRMTLTFPATGARRISARDRAGSADAHGLRRAIDRSRRAGSPR